MPGHIVLESLLCPENRAAERTLSTTFIQPFDFIRAHWPQAGWAPGGQLRGMGGQRCRAARQRNAKLSQLSIELRSQGLRLGVVAALLEFGQKVVRLAHRLRQIASLQTQANGPPGLNQRRFQITSLQD